MSNKQLSFVTEITPEEAALINGGRRGRGADDGPNHDAGDDKGGRRGGRGRRPGNPDGPGHT